MSRQLRLLAVALAVTVAATWLPDAPAAGQATTITYRPPVDAPVIDPFRAPASPYGPGDRGIDYATVAGTRYVTVTHADGLRSSYGGLASISVTQGAVLAAGAEVGRAGDTLHLGIRRGEEYLDPETLFAAAAPLVRLIPVAEFDAATA